jgi:protocatechuate 3,4-dioxygenase, alpha subunit
MPTFLMKTSKDQPPRQSAQLRNPGPTPSQTAGPFFAYGLVAQQYGYAFGQHFGNQLAQAHAVGERIRLEGQVLDADGAPITDALIEITHVDGAGRFPKDPADAQTIGFQGFGRFGTGTVANGGFVFETVKPASRSTHEAPHINLCIHMRGQLVHSFTRIYFADYATANQQDVTLQAVPQSRRSTLVASSTEPRVWRFNVHMQGPQETVFFDL